jgi:hypothetical protein
MFVVVLQSKHRVPVNEFNLIIAQINLKLLMFVVVLQSKHRVPVNEFNLIIAQINLKLLIILNVYFCCILLSDKDIF